MNVFFWKIRIIPHVKGVGRCQSWRISVLIILNYWTFHYNLILYKKDFAATVLFFLSTELHFCKITFCSVVMKTLWMLPTEDTLQNRKTVYWYQLNSSGVSPMPSSVNHSQFHVFILPPMVVTNKEKKINVLRRIIIKPQPTYIEVSLYTVRNIHFTDFHGF